MGGPDQTHVDAHLAEAEQIGAGHPAAQDVAHDSHLQPFQLPEHASQTVEVQQALSGMLARAVTGIDHRGVGVVCGHPRRPYSGGGA